MLRNAWNSLQNYQNSLKQFRIAIKWLYIATNNPKRLRKGFKQLRTTQKVQDYLKQPKQIFSRANNWHDIDTNGHQTALKQRIELRSA